MTLKLSKQTTKAELIQELQALQLIENEYRLLLDESSDPIFAFYPDGQYRYVNQAFANGVGHKSIDIIGKKIWDIFSKEEADKRFAVVRWVFENGQTKIIEVRVPRPDGDRFYVTTVKPIFGIGGAVASVICISKDITDRKQAEDEKLELQRQLINAQKIENYGIIASGFAHNFNNALTSVLGYINLSQNYVDKSLKAYDFLISAEQATKDAAGMASQLMIYSKEYKAIRKEPFSIVPLASKSADLCTKGSKVTSCLVFPPSLHCVLGDENLIHIVFKCICNNAVQAMPEGGTLTVKGRNVDTRTEKVPALAKGEYVEISFEDQGCGISEDDRDKIFTPYFTRKAQIGAGLGLATVHSVITRHGGSVTFASETGKGTTFTLYLPAISDPVQ